ncbi:anti-sigma factor family protein [Trinickia dinghuensis]|uniref:Anti-sigma factor n=1 Tax=Trinickia dinghuensis TaxID=2291023 RepID=A0A3D8JTL4_9BURK|nr:zf-HC2 domain-containing protein [Trinickia dinghuensis]RDU96006.1 anti-sigma factor [Trinickia dinghuensis]
MDCNEARPLLGAAVDRELSAAEALRVEQHLTTCPECRRETQALLAVSQATRTAEYFHAPDALRARMLAALPAVEVAPSHRNEDQDQDAAAAASAQEPRVRPGNSGQAPKPSLDTRDSHGTRDKRRVPGGFGWAWNAWRAPRRAGAGAGAARPTGGSSSAFGWPMGIAVAAVALIASVALVVNRPGSTERTNTAFVDELVQSHVRAQLSGHDIDVVSSDQHTVKPWFNGRLDYAPPVEDLADAGFALTGGRLDYVGHRRVAVLVYRYRKHVIDVYVMPETDAGTLRAPPALTSDGYAIARWRDQGMLWWAVSDAEPAVLAKLHAALTERLSRPPTGAVQ